MKVKQFTFCNGKLKKVLPTYVKPIVLSHLKKVGVTKQSLIDAGYHLVSKDKKLNFAIESDPLSSSSLDTPTNLVRYQYVGPEDDRNRDFCAEVLDLDLIYRKEDINMMSWRAENPDFGYYSIFDYCGSFGCRHDWDELWFSNVDEIKDEED
jgi:hypothetical protein